VAEICQGPAQSKVVGIGGGLINSSKPTVRLKYTGPKPQKLVNRFHGREYLFDPFCKVEAEHARILLAECAGLFIKVENASGAEKISSGPGEDGKSSLPQSSESIPPIEPKSLPQDNVSYPKAKDFPKQVSKTWETIPSRPKVLTQLQEARQSTEMKSWEGYKRRSKKWEIRIPFEILHSEALQQVKYCPTVKVFVWIYEKRKLFRTNKQGKKRFQEVREPFPFAYSEGRRRGLKDRQFGRAIRELVEKGFIDVIRLGSGLQGDPSLYYFSDRWRKYGTPDFEKKELPRRASFGCFGDPKKRAKKVINRQFQRQKSTVDQRQKSTVGKESPTAEIYR
jgi:hypothetical protein